MFKSVFCEEFTHVFSQYIKLNEQKKYLSGDKTFYNDVKFKGLIFFFVIKYLL